VAVAAGHFGRAKVMYKKIDRNFKRRWLKALRGQYKAKKFKQARDTLIQTGIITEHNKIIGYCCIAVGAVIAGVHEDKLKNMVTFDAALACGLDDKAQEALMEMNDNKKYGFKKIADWIGKNL
jgi:hypothetical protein